MIKNDHSQVAARNTSPDMTAGFHARSYGRFIEIKRNIRGEKLHRTNQGFNFLGSSCSNRDDVRAPIQFRTETEPQYLKRHFFPQEQTHSFSHQ